MKTFFPKKKRPVFPIQTSSRTKQVIRLIKMYLCDNPFNYSIAIYEGGDFVYVDRGKIKGKLLKQKELYCIQNIST